MGILSNIFIGIASLGAVVGIIVVEVFIGLFGEALNNSLFHRPIKDGPPSVVDIFTGNIVVFVVLTFLYILGRVVSHIF
jgi:hypothetical protein